MKEKRGETATTKAELAERLFSPREDDIFASTMRKGQLIIVIDPMSAEMPCRRVIVSTEFEIGASMSSSADWRNARRKYVHVITSQ